MRHLMAVELWAARSSSQRAWPVRVVVRGCAIVFCACTAVGCTCGAPATAADQDCAAAPLDAAAADAPQPHDSASDVPGAEDVPDAPPELPDAPVFDCGSCAPGGPCEELRCEGACRYMPVPDGLGCGDGVCVEGTCAPRGCGDGWRERGDLVAREGCDDRNTTSGDGCSALCEPEVRVVGSNPSGREWTTTGGGTSALDELGNLLVVWARERPGGEDATAIVARRFDRFGAAIDPEPFRLETVLSGDRPEPVALGLASGWVVAWSSRTIEGSDGVADGLAGALVPPSSPPMPTFQINTDESGTQREASLARIESGFVVAWEHQAGLPSDVRARLYDGGGRARSGEIPMGASSAAEGEPQLVRLGGDAWLAAWLEAPGVAIRARRYDGEIAGPAWSLYEGSIDSFVLAAAGSRLVLGVRDVASSGTIGVGTFDLVTATTETRAELSWMGSARDERDLAVAALRPDGWLALYRSTEIGGDRGRAVAFPEAAAPPELDRLRAAMRSAIDVERFAIADAVDGWVATWTARVESGYELRSFRFAP